MTACSIRSAAPGPLRHACGIQGFRSETQSGVELQVQQTARVDFRLEVEQLNQTLEVSGNAVQLKTEDATVGTVMEQHRIVDLPLNGRDFMQLISLRPGVTTGFGSSQIASNREGGTRAAENFSISGQRSTANHYTLDGIENTDVNSNLYIFLPSLDAIQEFKIQTGVYPAEFGRELSQVNVSTVSVTNEYHGTLFEFLRNNVTDANQYAFTATPTSKQPFKWNQYGFTLGGPLSIPKLFNAKDKLFFATPRGSRYGSSLLAYITSPQPRCARAISLRYSRKGTNCTIHWTNAKRRRVSQRCANRREHHSNQLLSPQSLQMLHYVPLPNQPGPGLSNNHLAVERACEQGCDLSIGSTIFHGQLASTQ